jgi:peptidoglycan hydrolase-like protein with peptidoglycan-binding domain
VKRTTLTRLAWSGGIVAALAVGVVAGRATFVPPQVAAPSEAPQTYTVVEATVGASSAFPATVRWPTHPVATAGTAGTVTSVALRAGDTVEAGTVLYSVDLRPVVAAQGAVPSFRDLAQGAEGEDVAQLQRLLVAGGHLSGQPSGRFDARTTTAVKAWQAALGRERTGTVATGDVVYVPTLPARLLLADAVRVGAHLSAEQEVLSVADAAPRFTLEVGSGQQADAIPTTGSVVEVSGPGAQPWSATVTGSSASETGAVTLTLEGPEGAPVCGTECELVPFSADDLTYPARVVTAPEVTGPAVPLAALGTAADGSQFVSGPNGERVPVTVAASDGSRAVVDGIEVGDVVLLFAEGADGSEDPEAPEAAQPRPSASGTP